MTKFDDQKHSGSCIGKETNAVLDDFETDSVAIAKHKLNGLELKVSHGAVVAAISESVSGQEAERIHIPSKSPLKDFSKAIRDLAERKNNGHSCADDLILAWESRIAIGELYAMSELLLEESKSNPNLLPLTEKFVTTLKSIDSRGTPIPFREVYDFRARNNMPKLVEFIEAVEIAHQEGIEVHLAAGNYRDEMDRDSNRMALANVILVGAVKGDGKRVEDYSRDGYGIEANTFHTGSHYTAVKKSGVDLDQDGKPDISVEEIIEENSGNKRIISPSIRGHKKATSLPKNLTGVYIAGTSFAVPKNAGKEGLTLPPRTTIITKSQTDSSSPALSGASTSKSGEKKKD